MLLDLSRIRTPHEHFAQVYPVDAFAADRDEFRVAAPVSLAFDIFKDKAQYRLTGRTQTTLELPCSRCLEPMTVTVDAPFDLRYQPHSPSAPGRDDEREIEEDDFATAFYENDQIDLGQLIHEQLYLAIPMKSLCGDGCRGLCPVCGTNLNRDTCQCRRDWEDPRFAALKALRATEPGRTTDQKSPTKD
jgi:uncharacterized protein